MMSAPIKETEFLAFVDCSCRLAVALWIGPAAVSAATAAAAGIAPRRGKHGHETIASM